jgi:hypothetical protein
VRLTELLGVDVFGSDGRRAGSVLDVRMAQRGPLIGSFGAALQPEWLIVGRHGVGARLGYDRGDVRGPLPIRQLIRRLHAGARLVPWSTIRRIEADRVDLDVPAHDLELDNGRERRSIQSVPTGGHIVDAGLDLLDRQLVDVGGRMAGNCDDLDMPSPDGGGAPFVTAILAGPGALASRIGGRPGRWIASVHARLQDPDPTGPASISFGVVKRLGVVIELSVHREDLQVMRLETWVRDRIISRIPGSD